MSTILQGLQLQGFGNAALTNNTLLVKSQAAGAQIQVEEAERKRIEEKLRTILRKRSPKVTKKEGPKSGLKARAVTRRSLNSRPFHSSLRYRGDSSARWRSAGTG